MSKVYGQCLAVQGECLIGEYYFKITFGNFDGALKMNVQLYHTDPSIKANSLEKIFSGLR